MAQLKSQRAGIRNEQPLVIGQERGEKEVYADPTGPRGDIYPERAAGSRTRCAG